MKAYKVFHGAKILENYLELCNNSFMSICEAWGMACNHVVLEVIKCSGILINSEFRFYLVTFFCFIRCHCQM